MGARSILLDEFRDKVGVFEVEIIGEMSLILLDEEVSFVSEEFTKGLFGSVHGREFLLGKKYKEILRIINEPLFKLYNQVGLCMLFEERSDDVRNYALILSVNKSNQAQLNLKEIR